MYDHSMEPLRVGLIGLGWWGGVLAQKTGGAGVDIVTVRGVGYLARDGRTGENGRDDRV